MKICVYAIALNESQFVHRFVDAAKDADMIVVADTGSIDDTVKLLEAEGAFVHHISIKPWRFDDARNACLALLPDDIDVCVSLDLDEVLQPGWRQEIERIWVVGQTNRMHYGFDWGCGIAFQYEKIHARHGFRWFLPCHERVVSDRTPEVWADTDMLMVIHKPDPTKSRGQYLDILRTSIDEKPTEARNAFYYARELSFHRQWQEAIKESERYLSLKGANWPNERCYAMRVISRSYQELGDWEASLRWLRLAASEAPGTREPWFELAVACYRMSRWGESLGAALTCLSITEREKIYTVDPKVWGPLTHDYASIAAWNLGLYELALKHAKLAVELDPDDLRLRQNLKFCEDKLNPPNEAAA